MAGYTRAGLLHYYPSKESMLLALLEQRDREVSSLVPDESDEVGIITLLRRLTEAPDFILRDRELVQLAHVLTAEASGSAHPAHEWVARRQARFRAVLGRAIRLSIQKGEVADGVDPDSLAAVIFGMIEGLEAQWLIDPAAVDPRAGHAALVELLKKNVSRIPTN